MQSILGQEKDNYWTLGLKRGKNETILGQKHGKSWKDMLQCLDILMFEVEQSQEISWLKTGQHIELRIHFANIGNCYNAKL